ncbi:MAG TPA: S41 family peptidase, partial [Phycisphaeraceae bacterium]
VEAPDEKALIEAAVQGMIESLDDPYTTYLDADDLESFDRYIRGSFSGIGAEVESYEDRLRIVTPLEDSPAWKAGVMAGDVILEINGQSTLNMELTEAVRLLTGEEGTQVTVRVRHESGQEETITITRAVINIQTVRGFRRNADQHFDFMLDDVNRIGYVRITQFIEGTADDLRQALKHLKDQGAKGLILDLRFNPGGLLESALAVSDMFLPQGAVIVSVEGRTVPRQVHRATGNTVMLELPIVVLANESSASAAEIVTGALKDNHRALFVGARTYGKGSVQQVKMLENGQGALKLTNAYYYIPSGRLIHRRPDSTTWGVDPSEGCYVPMSPEAVREMVEIRRRDDQVRADNGHAPDAEATVTPDYIEQELKDLQLAAALRALWGRLETSDWPQVGQSNTSELVKANQRAALMMQRDLLVDRLEKIDQELAKLNGQDVAADDDDSAASRPNDASADSEDAGDDDAEPAATAPPPTPAPVPVP